MAMLADTIAKDLITALKAHDDVRLRTLRMVRAAFQNAAIADRLRGELSDDAELAVLKREAKKRREAAAIFRTGGREDLAANEDAELAVLVIYLPLELSEAEVRAAVVQVLADPTLAGERSFGTVMKAAMMELRGRADAALVSRVVKECIG